MSSELIVCFITVGASENMLDVTDKRRFSVYLPSKTPRISRVQGGKTVFCGSRHAWAFCDVRTSA